MLRPQVQFWVTYNEIYGGQSGTGAGISVSCGIIIWDRHAYKPVFHPDHVYKYAAYFKMNK
jgi:hypothetical protein